MAQKITIALLSLTVIVVGAFCLLSGEEGTVLPTTSRTLVTAAHLGDIEGYERVWVDEETDFAVYIKTDYVAGGLSLGDIVSVAGTTAVVKDVSNQEFFVEVENTSKIVPGVSGYPVYLDGTPIGFISGWSGTGTLRCIFY